MYRYHYIGYTRTHDTPDQQSNLFFVYVYSVFNRLLADFGHRDMM